ncbi:ATP-grasp domain-containing protein [Seonamhaeicola marinus]|uniref:ATP-grasp domain-containing protein n=1 Tax=Seonamhaeicola marinus TaxID=1912246 RepID=A0A5D0HKA4_9FLAO|nr:ATP-grasp domain-containing protein [Seonamhaeicola marinus]TYA71824.1 ATP-grasp domain-containing protein [Seonamhaeicola marinus]
MNNKKIKILIPDAESYILEYVLNSFRKIKNVEIHIITFDRYNFMKFSKYVKKCFFHEESYNEKWLEVLDTYVQENEIDVILPILEKGIRFLIENRHHLKTSNKLITLPSLQNFNAATNKELLQNHLEKENIPCPKSFVFSNNDGYEGVKELKFPVIAKPVEGYGGGRGIKVFNSISNIKQYLEENAFKCNVIFQEFIEGYDITVNVLCENGNVVANTIQKGVEFENGKLTYQVGFNFVEDINLLNLTKQLMKSLNWQGVANIDFRYDEKEKEFKVIEINPRYWYNTDASAFVGVCFPYLNCLLFLNVGFDTPRANLIYYLNFKGLIKKVKSNPLVLFNIGFLKNHTPFFGAVKDFAPIVYKFIWRTKNILVKRFN